MTSFRRRSGASWRRCPLGRPIGDVALKGVGVHRYLVLYHEHEGKWTRCGHVWYDHPRWYSERLPGVVFKTRKEAGVASAAARSEDALSTLYETPPGPAPAGGSGPLEAPERVEQAPVAVGARVRGRGRLIGYEGTLDTVELRRGRWYGYMVIQRGQALVGAALENWEVLEDEVDSGTATAVA
jgi:hypothetical protein